MSHPAVAVYTKSNCMPCRQTKKELALRGVEFTEIDMEKDEAAREYVVSLGHQAAPVVVLEDGTSWASLRPDLINTHFGKRPA